MATHRLVPVWAALVVLVFVCSNPALAGAQGDAEESLTRDTLSLYVQTIEGGLAPEGRAQAWRERVSRALHDVAGEPVAAPDEWVRGRETGGVRPERLAAIAQVEALLVDARREAGVLREGQALRTLARAEILAETHADVPGSAAWIAEVKTAIGVVAAQAGLVALSEDALGAAATLDPSRILRAAEARPALVARAEAIGRAVANRPTGTFEVFADGPIATIYLDDREVGPAPARVTAPVGRHVVRVVAPGRRPWGRVIDVHEGRRPALHVRLSPTEGLRQARALAAAESPRAVVAALAALAEAGHVLRVLRLEVGEGELDRAVVLLCDASGCDRVQRLGVDDSLSLRGSPAPMARVQRGLREARAWLALGPPPPPPPRAWYRRWYVWTAIGAGLAAAAVGTGVALRPAPEQVLIIEPQPGDFALE